MRITRSATGAKRKSLAAALRQGPNAPVKLRYTASRRGRAPARSTSGKRTNGRTAGVYADFDETADTGVYGLRPDLSSL